MSTIGAVSLSSSSARRRNHVLKGHRHDALIDTIKEMLKHSFALNCAGWDFDGGDCGMGPQAEPAFGSCVDMAVADFDAIPGMTCTAYGPVPCSDGVWGTLNGVH